MNATWADEFWGRRSKAVLLLTLGSLSLALGAVSALALFPNAGLVNGCLIVIGLLTVGEGLLRRQGFEICRQSDVAQEKIASMLRRAKHSVLITSGSLNPKAYNEEFKILLEAKLNDGVEVEIVCGKTVSEEAKEIFKDLIHFPNLSLFQLDGNPGPHGMLVDDQALRIEKPHATGSKIRENIYIEKPTTAAAVFRTTFERYKERATHVNEKSPLKFVHRN